MNDLSKIKCIFGLISRCILLLSSVKSLHSALTSIFLALFFDIVQPSLTFNKSLTDKALQEDLNKIAYTRGSIKKGTLIISKGEVVEGEKYQTLESLKNEYQSQVWTESNYNWIVFAHTLLVALALLMLLLFLRKYRLEVFENNTKVTFIFFNIILVVLITTLVVNYNVQYIYIVPICILPLVLKAFFDARLGMFSHVITVLLLGSIVPNSYEYMFLQIIAGIVTILTVSELHKRANLFISVAQITLIYMITYFAFSIIKEGNASQINWDYFILFALNGLLSFSSSSTREKSAMSSSLRKLSMKRELLGLSSGTSFVTSTVTGFSSGGALGFSLAAEYASYSYIVMSSNLFSGS